MPTLLIRRATPVRSAGDFVGVDVKDTSNPVDQGDRIEFELIVFDPRHPRLRLVHALTELNLTQPGPPPKPLEALSITLVLVTHMLRVDRIMTSVSRLLLLPEVGTSPAERRSGPMTVLYLIVCGARPAESTIKHATDLVTRGWDTCVIATPEGARFFDLDDAQSITGHPIRISYKDPTAADVLPPADAVVIAPATFNTINKWAAGISDTLALGLLNEALGQGLPIVAAPWAKEALRSHPAYPLSLSTLRHAGVGVVEGAGEAGEEFPWNRVLDELTRQAPPPNRIGA